MHLPAVCIFLRDIFEFRSILASDPDEGALDEKSFEGAMQAVPRMTDDMISGIKKDLDDKLAAGWAELTNPEEYHQYKLADRRPLENTDRTSLAIAIFRCSCYSDSRRFSRDRGECGAPNRGRFTFKATRLLGLVGVLRHMAMCPLGVELHMKAFEAAAQLIERAGLNPRTATLTVMDRLGVVFSTKDRVTC